MAAEPQSFWDHLDELRTAIVKSVAVALVFGIGAFCLREELFAILLAPRSDDFVTYRLLGRIAAWGGSVMEPFAVQLINTGLARQFILHMKAAFAAGVLCASPYILYQIFRFVSPALHADERRYATRIVGWSYLMFMTGVLLNYLLIFPLTFRFLGTYQVDGAVENLISLDSYLSTLTTLSMVMGIVFEIPVLAWLFAKMGFLSAGMMRQYRRHAIVGILVAAAVITPTGEVFTLLLVSLPMWALYELSIALIR